MFPLFVGTIVNINFRKIIVKSIVDALRSVTYCPYVIDTLKIN